LKLAKPQVDIGLATNNLEPMLAFWQGTVGLKLDHVLPVRRGQKQHRHDAAGSVARSTIMSSRCRKRHPAAIANLSSRSHPARCRLR
jgi:hypothetical protein